MKEAITPPNDKEITKAVKSLKEQGALSLYKNEDNEVEGFVQTGNNESNQKRSFQERISSTPVELTEEDINDGTITPIGQIMLVLPIEASMSRLIYFGIHLGLADEAIAMAACSESPGIWNDHTSRQHIQNPEDMVTQLKKMMYWSRRSNSDHIANLKAFQMWLNKVGDDFIFNDAHRQATYVGMVRGTGSLSDKKSEMAWCDKMGLNSYRLHEAHQIADDIHRRLNNLGFFVGVKGGRQIHDKCKNLKGV